MIGLISLFPLILKWGCVANDKGVIFVTLDYDTGVAKHQCII